MPNTNDPRNTIRDGYAEIARKGQWSGVRPASALLEDTNPVTDTTESKPCCGGGGGGGGCCGPTTLDANQVATAVGYSNDELASIPDGANMGLSCGNPTALANLKPGETVIDLGCGGGFDCFIAGPRVTNTGHVIGVDMTPEMLTKARNNTASYHKQTGLDNVEFRLGEIEHLPIPDNTADTVISNCVINLSPDKQQVWNEIARVLKPGGRVAVSDLALLKPLPDNVRNDAEALVGCIAGADLVDNVKAAIQIAGLTITNTNPKPTYIETMTNWQDPLYQKIQAALPQGDSIANYITSLEITAQKPL